MSDPNPTAAAALPFASAARGEGPATLDPSARVSSGTVALPQAAADRGCRSTHTAPRSGARDPRPGLLTALLLSLGVHAAAAGALATVMWSEGTGPVDSPPIPIRIRLAPAAGGGAGGAAQQAGEPGAPGARGDETESAPSEELIVAAEPVELATPPEVVPAPVELVEQPPEPQPDAARWLLEVQADPHDVISVPMLAPSESFAAPDSSAPVASVAEWAGPPAPTPRPRGLRAPGLGLVDEGVGLGAGVALAGPGASDSSAGRGDGEGGGHGTGVGAGPGGREGGTGLEPVALGDNLAPEYPLEARRAGEEGLVVIHAQVSAKGTVTAAEVGESCGYALLDDAALAAVWQWRFQPALHDGKAVAQPVDVPIRFRLRPR
jgi:periplasmic protein TonB